MKQLLVALLLAGLAGLADQGTFASFSAVTYNDASIQTGTLVLSNKRAAATACLSTGGGTTDSNVNAACDAAFTLTNQVHGTDTVKLTLVNEGSLDASSLQLRWAGGTTPCTTIDEPTATYHGTGDLCGTVRLRVQEVDASNNDLYCWFGGNVGGTSCSFNNAQDLAAFSLLDGTGANVLDLGPVASGGSRIVKIGINIPLAQLTNSLMGRRVDFGFTWTLVQ